MENPTLEIRCRIVARIPTGIHRFDGNSHKIQSDSYRIRVGPIVGLNLLGRQYLGYLLSFVYAVLMVLVIQSVGTCVGFFIPCTISAVDF